MSSMCGRATNEDELQDIALGTAAVVDELDVGVWRPSYNIAPTQPIPVVGLREGERVVRVMRFGLVPAWVKTEADAKKSMGMCFNARGETVATKPSFRTAFSKRRCLVAVTGFYEWDKLSGGKVKQPYWIHPADDLGRYFTFAGVWEAWKHPETGEVWRTTSVVTTTPNARMAMLHDRMPVILTGDDRARWLDGATPPEALSGLIAPCPDAWLAMRPVGQAVGSPKHNGPELIAPTLPELVAPGAKASEKVA